MKNYLILVFIIICFCSCTNPKASLYVGTYTDGESNGIYKFDFNTRNGELTNLQLVAQTENPSFITYSPDKAFVYAVNENEQGSVSAFKVENNEQLSFLNKVSSQGAHPCHITINKSGNKAVISNYTGGNASIYNIKNDGKLNDVFQVLNHKTDSVVSHVHSAQFFEDHLFIADLGKNAVYNYKLKDENYKLRDSSVVKMEANSGPRHFALTKDGEFIYIINELSSTVTSAKKTENGFEHIETISTLADGFKDKSYCADIHLSTNENFVYGSNRGENSIVVFKRDKVSGKLEKIQNISVHGDWPRNFTLDPTGDFLLVANQKSNNISVFKIDETKGTLTFLNSTELDSPVCLLF